MIYFHFIKEMIKDLPLDIRLHILSFTDIDTKRYAGLPPSRLPKSCLTCFQIQFIKSQSKVINFQYGVVIRYHDDDPDQNVLHRYEILQHPNKPYEITKIKGIFKTCHDTNESTLLIQDYENHVYKQDDALYECNLRISKLLDITPTQSFC